ncbi:cbb3-type cytochrome c oxidase subunit I [Sulfurisphaera javensis]|uniref:Cbb3-type cytochrome c oxidase subunit I n=1 Tax=Sulfurisphaera javensis TaxID=2049879 RepID=A0AAT9GSA7_9CREN
MNGLTKFIVSIFQLDKDWVTRIVMAMIVMSLIWGMLGVIDALMVRIQEASWGLMQALPFTPQEYYASITLHGMRDLFGFAQQLEFAIFTYFTFKMLNLQPRAKWIYNLAFVLFNIAFMLIEGPILITASQGFDNYFPSEGWYYLSPLGVPGYSLYVVSPLWFYGWMLIDIATYMQTIWLIYHYYLASKTMKEKLPIFLVFTLMDILLYAIGYSGETVANVWDILAIFKVVGLNVIANQIAFGILWHAVVYMAWIPAVSAMYLLIPMLANKPLYSDKMGRVAAVLYLVFSNNVPIHHLYMVDLPIAIKVLTEILTYGVVLPSLMTFMNLWATAKGANVSWNILTAFTVMSFTGSIFSGVTGIANATITFDAIVHETMWVVGHFHGFILLSIVPAGFAVLYLMLPMMTGRAWYSTKLMWIHFWGYLIGASMVVIGFDELGLTGLIRKAEIYPLTSTYLTGELMSAIGAIIADLATVAWLFNVILTLVRGKTEVVTSIEDSAHIIMAQTAVSRFELESKLKKFMKI